MTEKQEQFELENRYFVIKWSDAESALSKRELRKLERLGDKVETQRQNSGKDPLRGIFVEDVWPEYSTVERLLKVRVETGKAPKVTIGHIPDKQELIDMVSVHRQVLSLLEPLAAACENFDKISKGADKLNIPQRLYAVRNLLGHEKTDASGETDEEEVPPQESPAKSDE